MSDLKALFSEIENNVELVCSYAATELTWKMFKV